MRVPASDSDTRRYTSRQIRLVQQLKRSLCLLLIYTADRKPDVHNHVIAGDRLRHEVEIDLPRNASEIDAANTQPVQLFAADNSARYGKAHLQYFRHLE